MARPEAEVLRLLNDVYAAGLGERRWTDALESIAGFFDAAGAVAFDLDRGAGTVAAMHAFGVGATQDDYALRMNAINPRMKRALLQPECHTSFDYEALPEAAIRWQEILRLAHARMRGQIFHRFAHARCGRGVIVRLG
jgi:hypothetical protein